MELNAEFWAKCNRDCRRRERNRRARIARRMRKLIRERSTFKLSELADGPNADMDEVMRIASEILRSPAWRYRG